MPGLRRLLVAALLVSLISGLGPARAETPRQLSGLTRITGVGTVAVQLEASTFTLQPDAVTLSTTGQGAALVLVRDGEGNPFHNLAVDVLAAKPNGCADGGPCSAARGFVATFHEGTSPSAPWSGAAYAAGRYTAYLIGQPGRRVIATIRAGGLSGTSTVKASRFFSGKLTVTRNADPLRAQLTGSSTFRSYGPAAIFQFLWTVDAGTLPTYSNDMQLCLDHDGEGTTTAPDQACLADATARPALLGGSSQGSEGCFSQDITRQPNTTSPQTCRMLTDVSHVTDTYSAGPRHEPAHAQQPATSASPWNICTTNTAARTSNPAFTAAGRRRLTLPPGGGASTLPPGGGASVRLVAR